MSFVSCLLHISSVVVVKAQRTNGGGESRRVVKNAVVDDANAFLPEPQIEMGLEDARDDALSKSAGGRGPHATENLMRVTSSGENDALGSHVDDEENVGVLEVGIMRKRRSTAAGVRGADDDATVSKVAIRNFDGENGHCQQQQKQIENGKCRGEW